MRFRNRKDVRCREERGKNERSNTYEIRKCHSFEIGICLVCTLPVRCKPRRRRYLHLGPENVRELKRDPISQAIECGDCHLSNEWHRAFYRRTVKCANRRSVPPLHFNQIIPLLCASVASLALKDLTRLKGLISLSYFRAFPFVFAFLFLLFGLVYDLNAFFRAFIVTRGRNEQ